MLGGCFRKWGFSAESGGLGVQASGLFLVSRALQYLGLRAQGLKNKSRGWGGFGVQGLPVQGLGRCI